MNDNLRIAAAEMAGGAGSRADSRSVLANIGDYQYTPYMGRPVPVCSGRARVGRTIVPGDLAPKSGGNIDPLALLAAAADAYAQAHPKAMREARSWAKFEQRKRLAR